MSFENLKPGPAAGNTVKRVPRLTAIVARDPKALAEQLNVSVYRTIRTLGPSFRHLVFLLDHRRQ